MNGPPSTIGMAQGVEADVDVVDAEAITADCSRRLQRRQGRQRTVKHVLKMLRLSIAVGGRVDIVNVYDVDARQSHPLQAVLERAQYPLARVVVTRDERQHVDIPILDTRGAARRRKQSPDLGGKQERISRNVPQTGADPVFRQALTIMGRGIEVTGARIVGMADQRNGVVIRKRPEQVAQRRAAEAGRRGGRQGLKRG